MLPSAKWRGGVNQRPHGSPSSATMVASLKTTPTSGPRVRNASSPRAIFVGSYMSSPARPQMNSPVAYLRPTFLPPETP